MPQPVEPILRAVAPISTILVLLAVARNFILARSRRGITGRRASFVATGSMLAYFGVVYGMIKLGVAQFPIAGSALRCGVEAAGALLLASGCIVNMAGRARLGQNWANQATLYDDQSLVTTGVFSVTRHPLYSSLICMSFGAGLLYQNGAVLFATAFVFVPAMYYRGSIEEKLLAARFTEYAAYRARTGMLFPKIPISKRI